MTDGQFEAWRAGTAALRACEPVTRDQAVGVFKALLEAVAGREGTEVATVGEPMTESTGMTLAKFLESGV